MLSNWLWISRCGDYWQQAELRTDGACRIMMMTLSLERHHHKLQMWLSSLHCLSFMPLLVYLLLMRWINCFSCSNDCTSLCGDVNNHLWHAWLYFNKASASAIKAYRLDHHNFMSFKQQTNDPVCTSSLPYFTTVGTERLFYWFYSQVTIIQKKLPAQARCLVSDTFARYYKCTTEFNKIETVSKEANVNSSVFFAKKFSLC